MDFTSAIPELAGAGAILAGAFKVAAALWDFLSLRIRQRMNKDNHDYELDLSASAERKANIDLALKLASMFDTQQRALDAITTRLTDTNPVLYGQMKTEILTAVEAVPGKVSELLPPQFDALKESVESSIGALSEQLILRLDQHDERATEARSAIKAEADAAIKRIVVEIDRLTLLGAVIEKALSDSKEQNDADPVETA